MTTPKEPITRRVAGRYLLGAVLGRGSMGTVWSAHDEVLGRPVAVKEVLLPPGIPDAEADILRERSLREARAIAALSHPNVVTLYDVAREDGAPFVVMELVASDSLATLLQQGPLPPEQVAGVGAAVAAALQAAHAAGITHRDVKPGNVLVAHDGRIKLTDFGIARNLAEQTMTGTGLMLGSPAYIAPEVASGGQVGPVADLWGLGATLFAAVEGRPPYDAGDPVATVSSVVLDEVPKPSCTGPLAEVISGLMVKDPARRMPLSEVRRLLGPPPMAELATPGSLPPALFDPLPGSSRSSPRPSRSKSAPGSFRSSPGPFGLLSRSSGSLPTPSDRVAEPSDRVAEPSSPPPAPDQDRPPTSPSGQLAADPGPLPFALRDDLDQPAHRRTATPRRAAGVRPARRDALRAVALWLLAVLLFLCAVLATFAVTRMAHGAPAFPALAARGAPGAGGTATDSGALAARRLEIPQADAEPTQFTIGVPTGWAEFRDQSMLGQNSGIVVHFVSPNGSELIAVERATGFLSDGTPREYLNTYRRELAEVVPNLVEARREELTGGMLDATFRTLEGEGPQGQLRRTSYLRLVPIGSDLWVVRVSMPTEREGTGRTELFEPVVAGFTPGA